MSQREWEPIVKELAQLIKDNDWSQNFYQAIADAKKADIPALDKINDLDDYLNSINDFLFWKPSENEKGDVVYNHICLFYWILDQPTLSLLQSQILPKEAGKPLTVLSKWMVDYANSLGAFYDKTDSINAATIQSFYDSPPYHMEIYKRPDEDWKTFNEFFAREVKDGERNPDDPTNPEVIVSAADSVFDGFWNVDDENNVFFVKGVPWNIKTLLDGCDHADAFKGGKFMHAFLNTTDYHRQHAPIMGTIVESKVIQGAAYLEVVPTPDPTSTPLIAGGPLRNKFSMRRRLTEGKTDAGIIRREYQGIRDAPDSDFLNAPFKGVDAPDNPGYQFLQSRGCMVIDSPIGLVGVLPIGMAQVSSVKILDHIKPGYNVEKGEEISKFQFGGSDIVLVFEAGAEVDFSKTIVGKHYNTGETLATATLPSIN
ncbi:hypothetical protein RUND412_006688 [Rhizina undulata]